MVEDEIFSVSRVIETNLIPEIEVDEVQSSRSIFQRLESLFLTYFSISSTSGLKVLAINGKCHRILWLFLFVVSIISCILVIAGLYKTREVTILNEKNTKSTFDIPFPAVTVCTTVKSDNRVIKYEKAIPTFYTSRDE